MRLTFQVVINLPNTDSILTFVCRDCDITDTIKPGVSTQGSLLQLCKYGAPGETSQKTQHDDVKVSVQLQQEIFHITDESMCGLIRGNANFYPVPIIFTSNSANILMVSTQSGMFESLD